MTTALTLTNQQVQDSITASINAGMAVDQSLVKLAPKGFVSGLRKARIATLNANGERMLGELRQQGYSLHRLSAIVEKRNGDMAASIELRKYAKNSVSVDAALAALGITAEQLAAFKAVKAPAPAAPINV